eukprot:4304836-Prymnesium_polylepis.1
MAIGQQPYSPEKTTLERGMRNELNRSRMSVAEPRKMTSIASAKTTRVLGWSVPTYLRASCSF